MVSTYKIHGVQIVGWHCSTSYEPRNACSYQVYTIKVYRIIGKWYRSVSSQEKHIQTPCMTRTLREPINACPFQIYRGRSVNNTDLSSRENNVITKNNAPPF